MALIVPPRKEMLRRRAVANSLCIETPDVSVTFGAEILNSATDCTD